mmetsp:Transcript_32477/g.103405  ORF Transcript_32477/g.103405 Transcript_32477/m.103405 type:complete len:354 (-) Transcript_32477:201-1262(-)
MTPQPDNVALEIDPPALEVLYTSSGPCSKMLKHLLRSHAPGSLRNGKRRRGGRGFHRHASPAKRQRHENSMPRLFPYETPTEDLVMSLPGDILTGIVDMLDPEDLAALRGVSRRMSELASCEQLWAKAYINEYGPAHDGTVAASQLAGGWRRLYAAKRAHLAKSAPWVVPSSFEYEALLQSLCKKGETSPPLSVLFCVDGSGSVTEEDFATMTTFMKEAVTAITRVHGGSAKVGVIQFSNDIKEELPLDLIKDGGEAFTLHMDAMERMNGGTNIASAIRKANAMLKDSLPKDCPPSHAESQAVVLLTDGRIDSYQAREAVERSARVMDEFPSCRMFALGVGRGVDKQARHARR